MEQNDLQRALMAVLFAAGEPVDAKRLSEALETDEADIHRELQSLMDQLAFNRSGIRIIRLEANSLGSGDFTTTTRRATPFTMDTTPFR